MKFRKILKQSAASLLVANGVFIYTFLGNILLMRMLMPGEFGVVALAASLVGLIEIVTTFSFSAVLIQQREQRSLVRSVFQLALAVIGIKLVVGALFFAVLNGRYDSKIWQLFWLILSSKMFSGIGPLLVARLEKRGSFLRATLVSNGSTAVAVSAAVVAVYFGAGVYGLALRIALPPVLVFMAMMIFYPKLFPIGLHRVNRLKLREVAAASAQLFLQRGAELSYMRIPLLFVESQFGTAMLGLFAQATYLVTLVHRVTSVVNHQIAFVFFAHNRSDAGETRHGYRWLLALNFVIAIPFMLLFWALPEPIVTFLWGEEWLGVVPFLKLMAAMILLLPIFALLKSRLMGLRRNWTVTAGYVVGLVFFALGLLLVPAPAEASSWVAGLSMSSYVVMVAVLWIFIGRSDRLPVVGAEATAAARGRE